MDKMPHRTLHDIQEESWQIAEEKGFHQGRTGGRDDTLVRLCLIHTEASEAAQVVKRCWCDPPLPAVRETLATELADIVIRVCDLAGCLDIDLEQTVLAKLEANRMRPRLYGTPWSGQGDSNPSKEEYRAPPQ